MIAIVDLDMGNLRSVSNAIYSLGFDFEIARGAQKLEDATHLIIPGVGSYTTAMKQVEKFELETAISTFAKSGRPVLGICLGMQILSESGDEGGIMPGLKLVPGKVLKLDESLGLAIPHVGWNNIELTNSKHPIFDKVKSGVDFYFVHSYQYECANSQDLLATVEYGDKISAIVGKDNVLGFQFHPEKSQANGLRLLENFCDWDGKC
ncbi:MAG: imidazole glycerol phosphate synthase subunit HisH [Oligoflexia bacterium]|nr:imidazole glycerol phosphate synthase subunit HisH [Oligoflexia bacterium]